MYLPPAGRYSALWHCRKGPTSGKAINEAMKAINDR